MKIRLLLGFFISLVFSSSVLAQSGYVQARQAELFAEPSLKATVVAVAHKGDVVTIEQQQGRWLKVKFGDKSGWVSTLLIGSTPPKGKITVLDESDKSLDQSTRRRASATAAAAAARGLRGDERARQSDAAATDFDALQKVEKSGVSEDEALIFQQQESEK